MIKGVLQFWEIPITTGILSRSPMSPEERSKSSRGKSLGLENRPVKNKEA